MNTQKILRIDSSGRIENSLTRDVTNQLTNLLADDEKNVVNRNLVEPLPFVNEHWIGANFTDFEHRTESQHHVLKKSDELIKELNWSDTIIIGAPIYNFSIPATLKAWVDMVARAKVTFKYTENGPVGLLNNKKAFVAMASGGVPIGSELDFASPYIKHVLGFIGINDVTIIDATKNNKPLSQLVGG